MALVTFCTTRQILYPILSLWALILLCLTAARLAYTTQPRDETSLNGGRAFYDPSVAELLVSAIFGLGFSLTMSIILYRRHERGFIFDTAFEVSGLSIAWLLWLGGSAASVTVWPDLSWCTAYSPCRLLQGIMGVAWLGTITLSVLLGCILSVALPRRCWREEAHKLSWTQPQSGLDEKSALEPPLPPLSAGRKAEDLRWSMQC